MIVGQISPPIADETRPPGLPATYRRVLRISAVLLSMIACLALWAGSAHAEGSVTFYPTDKTCAANPAGQCRANIEWDPGKTYLNTQLLRRTLLKVYAKAGETILAASSANGVNKGDIVIYDDTALTSHTVGKETFPASNLRDCVVDQAGNGTIASRAQELAGPNGTGGYTPCTYAVTTAGTYDVVMYGTDGPGGNADGSPTSQIAQNSQNFDTSQGTSIAAWDVTVRPTTAAADPTKSITGRLFTYYMTLFTGGNQRPVFFSVYPVTLDGYRYKTDLTGMDPNGWTLYGNDTGFFDHDGSTALYHDVIGNDAGVDNPRGVSGLLPLPSYPIFVNMPDPAAIAALGITLSPTSPKVSNLSFTGTTRTDNTSKQGTGGSFSFTSNISGRYELVIDHNTANPTYDPTDPLNRLIRGKGTIGSNTVSWDGNDNTGNPLPVGNGYSVEVRVHGGEYHFPLLDDENNTLGGPTFTVLNPPYDPATACPFAARSGVPCTRTAFYDDRPYTTQDKTVVQTYAGGSLAAATLCYSVGNPPAPTHSDPVNGFDSGAFASGNSGPLYRSFGTDVNTGSNGPPGNYNGGNANTPCDGAFGDTKGLDLWTYTPSQANATTLNIFNGLSLSVASVHSDPFVVGQTNASYTVTVANTSAQPTTGNTVVTYVVPAGLTVGTPSGGTGWTFAVSGQTVTATYSPALAGGATAPTFTIPITTVGGTARTDPNGNITASSTGAVDATTADKTNVVQPDVDVSIAPSAPTFTVGSAGQSWTATVSNHNATIPTTGLTTLKATLPTGESFTSTPAGTGWSCSTSGQVLTCTRSDTLATGTGSAFPVVTIPVSVAAPPTTPRTDTVPATADTAGETRQAIANGTVKVVQPGVSVALTDNKGGNFIVGATGQQYTATVSNASATVATNGTTTLTVTLPAGESFNGTPSGTGWVCAAPAGQSVTCTTSTLLPAGTGNSFQPVTIPVNVTSPPSVPRSDKANASADTANSAGPFTTNDLVTVNTPLSLSVASAHTDPFVVGQTNASYTVTVKNTSAQDTTGSITVTYVVPAGLTVGAPSGGTGWTFAVSGQTVTATYSPKLVAGDTAPTFTIPISAVAGPATNGTPYPNNQITATTAGATNATTSDPTNVVQPGVSVAITDNGSPLHTFTVGGTGQQYTATVSNASNTVATNGPSTLTIILPTGESFNGTPSGTGWVCAAPAGQSVTCTTSTLLPAGTGNSFQPVTIPVNVTSPPSVPRSDKANASADTVNSAGPATKSDTVSVNAAVSLSVASTHIDPFVVGQTDASYTVTVRNTSTQPTTGNTTVTYVVPSALTPGTPVSNDTPNHTFWSCTVSGQTVTCTTTQTIAANTTAPTFTIPLGAVAGPATNGTPYPNNQITATTAGATNATTSDPTNVVASGGIPGCPPSCGGGGTSTPEAPSSILFGVGALAVLAAVQRRRTRTKAA